MKLIMTGKKTIAAIVVAIILMATAIVAVSIGDAESVYMGRSPRLLPIYSVGTEENVVALSFDACWGADKTLGILDMLERYDVSANYFVVGIWVQKYPEILKKLSESGRIEVGTHSNTHPDMGKMSAHAIELELATSIDLINEVCQKKPELFRPPYGSYSDVLINTAQSLGLQTIQWDVDSLDWKGLSASEIASRVLSGVRNGSIVLMHNDGEHTLEALPLILEGLKNKGFTCKTIGDMIYRENYEIDHTGRQIRRT